MAAGAGAAPAHPGRYGDLQMSPSARARTGSSPSRGSRRAFQEYRGEVGTTWLVGPTIAMSLAIVAAVGFGLVAISPRQGSLLTYRWRRAVY